MQHFSNKTKFMKYNFVIIATAILLSTLLIASGCKKDKTATEEQLPPETQTGAFTIGFKVDGKIYTAKGKGGLLADENVYYNFYSDTTFYIGAGKTQDRKFSLYFKFKCVSLNTNCSLNSFPYDAYFQDDSDGTVSNNSNSYTTNNTHNGNVKVKFFNGSFNPLASGTIVSGVFEFKAVNSNGKIINITDGRFDIGK